MKLTDRVAFTRELFTPAFACEALPLMASHWQEIAHFKDIPLDPEFDAYYEMEKLGGLRLYTFRKDRALRGYAIFFVRYNAHYKTSLQAQQDVLYLDPKERGFNAIKFLKYCDAELKAEGVQAVYHHVKAAHNFGLILQRQGYELVDLVYAKRLD